MGWIFRNRSTIVAAEPDGTEVYAEYIKSLLDYEQTKDAQIDTRASTIVTTSGILVTLLFAFTAIVTRDTSFRLPRDSVIWLALSVILFVVATGLAVAVPVILFPHAYDAIDERTISSTWRNSASSALAAIMQVQLQQISRARQNNRRKALLIAAAGITEVLALLALSIAVLVIAANSPSVRETLISPASHQTTIRAG
jgi:O-antigen/teichoic acid export membrane protein